MLRQFPGYTLGTLRQESTELLRLLEVERLGSRKGRGDEWPS